MGDVMHIGLPEGLDQFLAKLDWADSKVSLLAADASFRRYFRAQHSDGRSAVIMDAPPPHEDPRPFIELAEFLVQSGFRAPAIWGQDLARGLVLLEDFGDVQMRQYLDLHPEEEVSVYKQAIDILVKLAQKQPAPLAAYDMDTYLREVKLFTEWFMPTMELEVDENAYLDLWRSHLDSVVNPETKVTVLRDYHSENIMILDNGGQGIIDFQDALVGHPAYDLVSLLQDARRDVSPALEAEMLDYYRQEADVCKNFDLHYALIGAQRNTKIIGIFTRLWKRDGKARYLHVLPRMWGLLERDLAHPGLVTLKAWFDTYVPAEVRLSRPNGFSEP
jgi:N-acetylmuramate 1-kinase